MRQDGCESVICDAQDLELINDVMERSIASQLNAIIQHEIHRCLLPRMSNTLLISNIYTQRGAKHQANAHSELLIQCVHEKTGPPKYNGIVFEILGRHR